MTPARSWLLVTVLLLQTMPARAQAPTEGPVFRPMGFGDVSYVISDAAAPEGFLVGQLVGQLTAALTDRLTIFTEVSGTARADGYGLDVERLFLRYDFTDVFKLSAGRYHTPTSYWNTAYHHGLWLQTTTARPEMIRLGSRLIPVHFVGVLVEGAIEPGRLGINYALGIGNGRGANIARAGDAGDIDDNRAFTASLNWRPSGLTGLQLGGAAYIDRVTTSAQQPDLRERIVSAHIAWAPGTPEVIAEYARVSHAPDVAAASFGHTHAFYAQASVGLSGTAAAFRPYGRFETIRAPTDVAFTPLVPDYDAVIAGLRFDFDLLAALKAEIRRERFADEAWRNSLVLQASFALAPLGGPTM